MAKDLRGLLEPAATSAAAKGSHGASTLAQRRSLSSPGEPRVYRVRSGFVCGLCGNLHGALDKAFECLGRCTIELRLRSPAGPTHQGTTAHFACTACGRGFANCDDAEQCFERCLVKMKPTPQFEVALRRVQVRYMQRLASHGVRSLERIDPLSEHTKMLSTLTREQQALGKKPEPNVAHAPQRAPESLVQAIAAPKAIPKVAAAPALVSASLDALAEDGALNQAVDDHVSLKNDSSEAQRPEGEGVEAKIEASEDEYSETVSAAAAAPASEEAQPADALAEAELTPEEAGLANAQFSDAADGGLDASDVVAQDELLSVVASLGDQDLPETLESSAKPNQETSMRTIVEGAAVQLDLSTEEQNDAHQLFAGQDNVGSRVADEGASALSALAFATPETFNEKPLGEENAAQAMEGLSLDISDSLNALGADSLGSDSLGGAFEEASEFASIAEQPSLTETMGADVLAILQAPPEGENLELDTKQHSLLKEKTVTIDNSLLDSVTSDTGMAPEVTEVFVRKQDMKPYRRNNARYTCSACSKDFFTKEQVDACFYSHPEEGSEEERMLREKVEKIKAKSAA